MKRSYLIIIVCALLFCSCDKNFAQADFPKDASCFCSARADRKNTANAKNAAIGRELRIKWRAKLGVYEPSAPITCGGAVFVATRTKKILAFNANTGAKLADIWTDTPLVHPPTIFGSRMFFMGTGGYNRIGAYDLRTGKKKWSRDVGDADANLLADDSLIFFGTLTGNIYALESLTGKKVWEFHAGAPVRANAVFTNNILLFPVGSKVLALNANKVNLLWTNDVFAQKGVSLREELGINRAVTSLIATDSLIIVGDGEQFVALTQRDGIEQFRFTTPFISAHQPATDGERIFLVDGRGTLTGYSCTDGSATFMCNVGEVLSTAPTICGDEILVSTVLGKLIAINRHTGAILSTTDIGTLIRQPLCCCDTKIFVCTALGELLCLE